MKTKPFHLLVSILFSLHLFAQPVITSFAPVSAPMGTPVVINGSGFSETPASNIVYFGSVRATVSAATSTSLSVTVPVGATYQPISVTTNNLTAYSANAFNVTFSGSSEPFSLNSFVPKLDFTSGVYPHSVLLGDFNGDNKNDVLVTRGSSDNVSVFRNTSTNGNISFAAQRDFPATGFNHEGSAIADMDGDGKLDFIITNSHGTNSVSVFRNTSTGNDITFASKIDYAADNSPYSVAAGDIDQDGKPDMIIINAGTGSDKVSIYKNTSSPGNISFAARADFATGTSPYSVAVGDLNGDGKPELAITTQYLTSALSVMKNTTTGGVISFEAPVDYVQFPGPFTVTIGDLDNDNKPDLAAACSGGNSVVVLRNASEAGTLSFSSAEHFTTGSYPVCVAIADLNGDGKPDLATSNRYGNSVSALRNTSSPGHLSFDNASDYPVGKDPFYLIAGDLDGDERPDIVAANSSDPSISVLRNIVAANVAPTINSFTPVFGTAGTIVTIKGSNFTGTTTVKFGNVPAASFTIDSATGITAVVGAGATGDVSVTTANGTVSLGTFTFNGPIINSFTPMIGVEGTVVTIYGSNFTDATVVKFGETPAASFTVVSSAQITATVGTGSSGNVTVTTPTGTATLAGFSFGTPVISSITPASGPIGSPVIINGTSFSPTPADNIVYFGAVKATVTSATSTQLNVIVPAGATYEPITVTVDHLTAYSSQPFNTTFDQDTRAITTNYFAKVGDFGVGAYPFGVTISDVNGDAKPDIIAVNGAGNSISILKNNSEKGTIVFDMKTDFNTGPDPRRIAVGDLDGDGKPDIAVSNMNAGNASTISILRNTSSGGAISFAQKTDYSSGNGSIGIAIADMNGDGKPDVIVTSGNSGIFSIFQNTTVAPGTITFAAKQDFTLLTHPDNITVADLDNDGRTDLIISGFSNGGISVYQNTSTGGVLSLAPKSDFISGTHPSFVTTGDLNSDGKLDVIVSNYNSGNGFITFFKNNSNNGFISLQATQGEAFALSNVSVGDLNGDGKPDLCAGRGISGKISVFENIDEGFTDFSFGNNIEFTTGNYDTYVAIGDLDGDGKPELVAANTTRYTVTILKNRIGAPEIIEMSSTTATRGTTVTLTGNNLSDATAVNFGGIPAASFVVVSPSQIDAVVEGGASGDITVVTPKGTGIISGFNFIPEISANGPTDFCSGEFVTLSSTADANNQWYKDGVLLTGFTGKTIQAGTSGTYSLKTTGNGVTTSSPGSIPVAVTTIPAPVIVKNANNDLVSSAAAGNQWYFNGTAIPGATGITHQPLESGEYTVKSSANGCTSDFSIPYTFVITGMINLGNGEYINLYPNPVKDKMKVTWNISGSPAMNIQVSSLQGNQLQVLNNVQAGTFINLGQYPPGLYLVKIYNPQLKINETVTIFRAD